MPTLYRCPSDLSPGAEDTSYVMFTGKGTVGGLSDKDRSLDYINSHAGAAVTILAVEVPGSKVHWMEPRDLTVDEVLQRIKNPAQAATAGCSVPLFATVTSRFSTATLLPKPSAIWPTPIAQSHRPVDARWKFTWNHQGLWSARTPTRSRPSRPTSLSAARGSDRAAGRFTLVLAGGATPERTYALLARPARRESVDWSKTYIFFGDERFVPPDDPRSNFGMTKRTLLAAVPVPPSHVFPIPTDEPTAAAAAVRYAAELASLCRRGILPRCCGETSPAGFARKRQDAASTSPARFDLILLGLGEDGHTASLFPSAAALEVEDAWVTSSPPGVLPPPVDRITMTYPVLNAARHVAFLVAGERKAAVLYDVLEGRADPDRRPAAGVRPRDGTLTWFVDQHAAKLLSRTA